MSIVSLSLESLGGKLIDLITVHVVTRRTIAYEKQLMYLKRQDRRAGLQKPTSPKYVRHADQGGIVPGTCLKELRIEPLINAANTTGSLRAHSRST